MSKINLKAGGANDDSAKKKKRSSNKSIIMGVVFLLLAFGVYGGLLMVNKSKEKEKQEIEHETLSLKKQMDGEKYQEIYDFEERLSAIRGIINEKTLQENLLHTLSQYTLESTHYQNLSVKKLEDELRLSLSIRTVNLEELSKQADSFGKIEGISKILIVNASPYAEENETGIEAAIDLIIPNQKIH